MKIKINKTKQYFTEYEDQLVELKRIKKTRTKVIDLCGLYLFDTYMIVI